MTLHNIEKVGGIVQVHARQQTALPVCNEPDPLALCGGLAPGQRGAEGILEHRGQSPPALGRPLFGLGQKFVIKPNGGPHTSKHIMVTSICQFHPIRWYSNSSLGASRCNPPWLTILAILVKQDLKVSVENHRNVAIGSGLRPVRALFVSLAAMCSIGASEAGDPGYNPDPSTWQEKARPPRNNRVERSLWRYAANYSSINWRVFVAEEKVQARRRSKEDQPSAPRPDFAPNVGRLRKASAFLRVDDGWLVGFNQGEFGAALYWFSQDGRRNYKVSDHQVVDFVSTTDRVLAIEGLAHLGISRGSLIRIARANGAGPWMADSLTRLPFAPYAVSRRRGGELLITLSDSMVSVVPNDKPMVRTLLADADWGMLYPNSSALTPDERKLYIGMRQFVVEFDLQARHLRFLLPGQEFLNRLSRDDEDWIRAQEAE